MSSDCNKISTSKSPLNDVETGPNNSFQPRSNIRRMFLVRCNQKMQGTSLILVWKINMTSLLTEMDCKLCRSGSIVISLRNSKILFIERKIMTHPVPGVFTSSVFAIAAQEFWKCVIILDGQAIHWTNTWLMYTAYDWKKKKRDSNGNIREMFNASKHPAKIVVLSGQRIN